MRLERIRAGWEFAILGKMMVRCSRIETLALSRAVFILKELTTVEFRARKKRSASEKNGPRGKVVVGRGPMDLCDEEKTETSLLQPRRGQYKNILAHREGRTRSLQIRLEVIRV